LLCFLMLGWPLPRNVLDLYVETAAAINGNTEVWAKKSRPGLLDALELHGLGGILAATKKSMREVITGNERYTERQRRDIQRYNKGDVEATLALIEVMAPSIDLPHALLRGRFMAAEARMYRAGIPVSQDSLGRLLDNWDAIRRFYIRRDDDLGLYEDLCFREARLEMLVKEKG
jgi:DNA polymerase I